jgi:uncharacterized protein
MSKILIWVVRGYQFSVGPLLGASCRFTPSCSQFAIVAIRRYGALRGAYLSLGRVLRCHPWHPGGADPVP